MPLIWEGNIPFKNDYFVGRTEFLNVLREELLTENTDTAIRVIVGLGGTGKSRTARQFVYKNKKDYQRIIWWFNRQIGFDKGYRQLAEQMNEKLSLNINIKNLKLRDIREKVKEELRGMENWLLIFDDVENYEQVKEYLPQHHANGFGHVIITSRNVHWENIRILKLETFSRDESIECLRSVIKRDPKEESFSPEEKEAGAELANLLGYLPLALVQAGAYIYDVKTTIQQYSELFKRDQTTLLKLGDKPEDYNQTIAKTWALSVEKIKTVCPAALEIIKYSICLDNYLHKSFLKELSGKDDIQMNEIIKHLTRYSLIESDTLAITIHPLVQRVLQVNLLSKRKRTKLLNKLVKFLASRFYYINSMSRLEVNQIKAELVPHVLVIIKNDNIHSSEFIDLIMQMGVYQYHELSNNEYGQELLNRAKVLLETTYPKDQRRKCLVLYLLGNVLFSQSLYKESLFSQRLYEEAGDYYRKSLDIFNDLYNKDNAHDNEKAAILHQIGNTLSRTKKYNEASGYYKEALRLNKSFYKSKDDTSLANNYHELAFICAVKGNYDEAIKKIQRAVRMKINIHGTDIHPDVAVTMDMWGNILCHKGDYSAAGGIYLHALKIYEKTFGKNHDEYKLTKSRLDGLNLIKIEDDFDVKHFMGEKSFRKEEKRSFARSWEEIPSKRSIFANNIVISANYYINEIKVDMVQMQEEETSESMPRSDMTITKDFTPG